ncbi:MAG TPA: fumarylacetoacetate hydrolase family protein [Xanthobacteraceae bacterium]|nr:fumarylacetoacetate hydrolase family protein [Xanthobacteraceae bacterium]
MRLASYRLDGEDTYGVVVGDGVVTLGGRNARHPTLRDALAADAIGELRSVSSGKTSDHKLAQITYLPLIANPAKILCVGINYRDHAAETGRDTMSNPQIFLRLVNTLVAHEGAMIRPKVSTNFDFEGELAVIIGKGGRHIRESDALAHVAGYTCFVDGSVRDWQKHSVTAGKNFIGTGPLGPWMVTSDEIPDPARLTLTTQLNGQEMQRSGTDMLIYAVPRIISYISTFTPLEPGDVIATGTPAGVGMRRNPPVWMKAGDVLEVEISGIGTLRSRIVDEK